MEAAGEMSRHNREKSALEIALESRIFELTNAIDILEPYVCKGKILYTNCGTYGASDLYPIGILFEPMELEAILAMKKKRIRELKRQLEEEIRHECNNDDRTVD